MHNHTIFFFNIVLLSVLSGCILGSSEPGEYIETELGIESDYVSPVSGTIATIINNDVYLQDLANEFLPQQLTDSPSERKTKVTLNYAKDRIAYLNTSGQIKIIDIEGNVLETVENTGTVLDLGWSGDDQTLYMFVDDHFEFHGPDMDLPSVDAIQNVRTFISVDVSRYGDLIYVIRTTSGSYFVGISYKQSQFTNKSVNYYSQKKEYVKISPDGERFLIATSSQEGQFNRISFYKSDDFFQPDQISSRSAFSPEFSGEDGQYLIYTTRPSTPLSYSDEDGPLTLLPFPLPQSSAYFSIDWKP